MSFLLPVLLTAGLFVLLGLLRRQAGDTETILERGTRCGACEQPCDAPEPTHEQR
jgi:hypothetical protein